MFSSQFFNKNQRKKKNNHYNFYSDYRNGKTSIISVNAIKIKKKINNLKNNNILAKSNIITIKKRVIISINTLTKS